MGPAWPDGYPPGLQSLGACIRCNLHPAITAEVPATEAHQLGTPSSGAEPEHDEPYLALTAARCHQRLHLVAVIR